MKDKKICIHTNCSQKASSPSPPSFHLLHSISMSPNDYIHPGQPFPHLFSFFPVHSFISVFIVVFIFFQKAHLPPNPEPLQTHNSRFFSGECMIYRVKRGGTVYSPPPPTPGAPEPSPFHKTRDPGRPSPAPRTVPKLTLSHS